MEDLRDAAPFPLLDCVNSAASARNCAVRSPTRTSSSDRQFATHLHVFPPRDVQHRHQRHRLAAQVEPQGRHQERAVHLAALISAKGSVTSTCCPLLPV